MSVEFYMMFSRAEWCWREMTVWYLGLPSFVNFLFSLKLMLFPQHWFVDWSWFNDSKSWHEITSGSVILNLSSPKITPVRSSVTSHKVENATIRYGSMRVAYDNIIIPGGPQKTFPTLKVYISSSDTYSKSKFLPHLHHFFLQIGELNNKSVSLFSC